MVVGEINLYYQL